MHTEPETCGHANAFGSIMMDGEDICSTYDYSTNVVVYVAQFHARPQQVRLNLQYVEEAME